MPDNPDGQLHDGPARVEEILESITDAFYSLDGEFRFTYVNRRCEERWGRPRADLLGRPLLECLPQLQGSVHWEQQRRAMAERRPARYEAVSPVMHTWVDVSLSPTADGGLSVFFRDISERRAVEDALRRSREDLQHAVDAARIGTFYCDWPFDRITWNATCKRHFFLPDDAEVDFALFYALLHPDDRAPTRAAIDRAMAGRVEYNVEYRVVAPDGRTRWVNAVGRGRYDAAGAPVRFDGITLDITPRVERRRRERFLAELAERARGLTDPGEVIADAVRSVGEFLGASRCLFADIDIEADTCTVPPEYRADDSVASIAGTFPISAFGAFVVAEYRAGRTAVVEDTRADPVRVPPESLAAYEAIGVRAYVAAPVVRSARLVSALAAHSATPRHWEPEEVALLQTVVERTWLTVEVLRRGRALAREAAATARILESITEAFFTVDREWRYTYINRQVEALWGRARAGLLGRTIWEVWPEAVGSVFERQFRRAMTEGVAVSFEEFFPPLDAWLEVRVNPSPDGLSVFFQDVTARKRAEAELRARAAREALVNRIGEAVRAAASPALIQERAAALLGEALGADRCFYVTYDLARDRAQVSPDWRRADLPSVAGDYRASDFGPLLAELFPERRTAAVGDVRESLSPSGAAAFEAARHRAVLVVPFFGDGGLVAALYVSMADAPRAWTEAEVALAERAATLTRASLEEARVRQREHNIAVQLAQALQPDLPGAVPGLALTKYYEPALAESEGVGGDFYDCFALDKGRTALAVGDLSGKGLAAAGQVAAVRHGLRTTLHLGGGLAAAATDLNRVLAEQNSLTGFATLFVGAYDSAARTLTYVNCGQEPALVRRASTGRVEALPPTGPVLGGFEGALYDAGEVRLSPGDALAVFSDGVTEVGRTRTEMLGLEGVTALFAQPVPAAGGADPDELAELLALRLIAGVDAAAQGGVMRDDICLLVAVVT